MKVAIHQPQYLPWVPYFLKIDESDIFIFLDTVDFQKNGLQNRNQIKTAQGLHWLTIPVRQQLGQKIRDVKIDNSIDWRRKHWQSIRQCYSKAQAFKKYEKNLESIYIREWNDLSELNFAIIVMMMRWMGIQTPILRSSQMKAMGKGTDLVLNLCLEVGATHYISGKGGKNYLELNNFNDAGVEIIYSDSILPSEYLQLYPQKGFINNLSALDILLNSGSDWRKYIPEESSV